MARLLIMLALIFILALFIRELKRYFIRDQKEETLKDTFIEGDLVDLEYDIAEEKARQEKVRLNTQELKKNIKEEKNND